MKRLMTTRLFVLATICCAASGLMTHAANLPAGFQETNVLGGTGLTDAAAVRFAPDGRVFIAERSGIIKVFDDIDDPTPTIFADLSTEVYNAWDRGLLGLAIHPQFPAVPFVYAFYTHDAPIGGTAPVWNDQCPDPPGFTNQGCVVSSRLVKMEADGDVMLGNPTVLIEGWCQQYPSHSVGDLWFGPSGALYASHGDGASFSFEDFGQVGNPCGDPPLEGGSLRVQDVAAPGDPVDYHGAIIRIDALTGAAMPDNPLVGGADATDDRLVAYGLRNPFRFTVRPGTEELWIGDVGWGAWEDIERLIDPLDPVVTNFGWPCYEGPFAQPGFDGANLPICESLYVAGTATPPYHAYIHDGPNGNAISGLAFYDGTGNYPALYDGALFFADFSGAWIKVMYLDKSGNPDPGIIVTFSNGVTPVDLQIGPGGDLYYLNYDRSGPSYLRRIRYFEVNLPPVAIAEADVTSGLAPLAVQFVGSNSFDPDDGDTISFAWDLDGDGAFDDATQPNPSYVYTTGGFTPARLRVTDDAGLSSTDTVLISVDNNPPLPFINEPTASFTWRVGDPISFEGFATDPDTGPLPAANLDWDIVLHHCEEAAPAPVPGLRDHDDEPGCHQHFLLNFGGVSSGSFSGVDHEYPSFLEVVLTASDDGQPDWWDPAWSQRRRLVIDNSARAENLDGFPLLVRLDPGRIDYALTSPDGDDLRFVDSDNTPLPHEVEAWNAGGVSWVWVLVPRIDAASNTDFVWMYHGNNAAANAENGPGVWNDDYAAVWHLDDAAAPSPASAPGAVLLNPGFESGTNGWTAAGNVYVEPFDPHSGGFHLKMFGRFNGVANESYVYQDLPAVAGETWSIHCYAKHITGDAVTGTQNYAEMRIAFLDAGTTLLASQGAVLVDASTPTDVWQVPPPLTLTAPANTAVARAMLVFAQPLGNESGAVFYDDVSFQPGGTTGYDVFDATANQNDGTSNSAPPVAGQIAGARQFNGGSSIDVGSRPSVMLTNAMTISTWIKLDVPNVDSFMRILSKKTSWDGPAGYEFEYNPERNYLTALTSGPDFARADGADLDTAWHHVAASIDNGFGTVYVDGLNVTTDPTVSPLVASPQGLRIGMSSGGGAGFGGAIDEMRIARVPRSPAWIQAEYASMTDGMVTYGPPETRTPLEASTCVEIQPETTHLTLVSDPPGLQLTANGVEGPSPFERELIVFSQNAISAPTPQTLEGINYVFQSWSDAGAQAHNILAPEVDETLVASFASFDVPALANCLTGPAQPPTPAAPITPAACLAAFDADEDGDVDLADVAAFELLRSGE